MGKRGKKDKAQKEKEVNQSTKPVLDNVQLKAEPLDLLIFSLAFYFFFTSSLSWTVYVYAVKARGFVESPARFLQLHGHLLLVLRALKSVFLVLRLVFLWVIMAIQN